MAQIFPMPQLGSTMEEGTILKWHKQEGDPIKEGEVLLEIETDKASMEVEAPTTGVVRKILALANALVPIRQPIAILGTADEPIAHLLGEENRSQESAPQPPILGETAKESSPKVGGQGGELPTPFLSPRARRVADEQGVSATALAGRGTGIDGRVVERDVLAYMETQATSSATTQPTPRATPLATRIANDLGIDLNDLATGLPGSRVWREDVLRHADQGTEVRSGERHPTPDTRHPLPDTQLPTPVGYDVVPFAGMRKRIADNVVKSAFTAPHVTLTLEVDMTAASEFRTRLLPDIEKRYGTRLSYTDILVKAVARALEEHPRLNSSLVENELRVYKQKNIGVAVALDEGLIVPVVKGAESKGLGAISAEAKQLIERARTGKFTPDDLSGGTFTITNLGTFGIDVFDPIIVTGQAAILGVGRIADKPVVINKQVVVRSMMNLCLSFDHRIVDGAPVAKFLQRLKELLESPMLILI